MNEDRDYMKEAADMLRSGCRMRFNVDEDGDLFCDCRFCIRNESAEWYYCSLTDSDEDYPKDWRIE